MSVLVTMPTGAIRRIDHDDDAVDVRCDHHPG